MKIENGKSKLFRFLFDLFLIKIANCIMIAKVMQKKKNVKIYSMTFFLSIDFNRKLYEMAFFFFVCFICVCQFSNHLKSHLPLFVRKSMDLIFNFIFIKNNSIFYCCVGVDDRIETKKKIIFAFA